MLVDLSELVGDVLRDVVVDEGVGRVDGSLDRCVVWAALEMSWKLVVLFSQSCRICESTGLSLKIGSQCFFNASAIAVGVVASSSWSVSIAPMLLVLPGMRRANLVISCCFLRC